MRVLVTGANSLLGTNLLLELLKDRYYQVRGMVRSKNRMQFHHPDLEVVLGDVRYKETLSKAFSNYDVVIHTAANTSQKSLHYRDYSDVNVEGTLNVLTVAKASGVKRVIVVSSANAFAYGSMEQPGTEAYPINYPFSRAGYARSKFEAQQAALNFSKKGSPEVIIVNPTFMIGGYDQKPSSGTIITRGYKKRTIFVPPGGKNFVHVRDVAAAICNAIHMGKPGSCYLLANKNMTYKTFYKKLNEATGQNSRIVVLPKFVLLGMGCIGSVLAHLGIANSMHYINMRILCTKNYYTNRKAVRELGLRETPITEAISEALEWFLESGMLKFDSDGQK